MSETNLEQTENFTLGIDVDETPAEEAVVTNEETGAETPQEEAPATEEPVVPAAQPVQEQPSAPELNQEVLTALARLVNQQQQQPAQPQPEPESDIEKQFSQPFQLKIPDQFYNAMVSEDPAQQRQAFEQMFSAAATIAFQQSKKYFEHQAEIFRDNMMNDMRSSTERTTLAQQVQTDFYAKHPQFANPAGRALAQQVAQTLIASRQAAGKPVQWDADFAKDLSEGMTALVQQFSGQPAPTAKTPFKPGPSARPAPTKKTLSDDIMDVVAGF